MSSFTHHLFGFSEFNCGSSGWIAVWKWKQEKYQLFNAHFFQKLGNNWGITLDYFEDSEAAAAAPRESDRLAYISTDTGFWRAVLPALERILLTNWQPLLILL